MNLVRSHPVTIEFEEGKVTGTASCNGYGGAFEIDGSNISIGDLFLTEKACMPPETMVLESAFAAALASVNTISLDDSTSGKTLHLTGPDTELQFEPMPQVENAELMGTVWVLTEVLSGESTSSVLGDTATLEYFTDGSFLASTGCRTLIGTYTETESGVVTKTMQAEGTCPPEIVDQDSLVVSVLEGDYVVRIVGKRLTLTGSGVEGLTYTASE